MKSSDDAPVDTVAPIKVSYRVHSVAEEPVPVTATYRGADVNATVPGLVVELTDDAGRHGHIFHFIPETGDDLEYHRRLFRRGAAVTLTFGKE